MSLWFAGALSCVLERGPGKALAVAGLVQIFLLRVLGLRYVGFGASGSVSLPLLEREEKLATRGRTPSHQRTEGFSAGESDEKGRKVLRILSHNVWCHMLQQWYAPAASKRLDCLRKAIEAGGYDIGEGAKRAL